MIKFKAKDSVKKAKKQEGKKRWTECNWVNDSSQKSNVTSVAIYDKLISTSVIITQKITTRWTKNKNINVVAIVEIAEQLSKIRKSWKTLENWKIKAKMLQFGRRWKTFSNKCSKHLQKYKNDNLSSWVLHQKFRHPVEITLTLS